MFPAPMFPAPMFTGAMFAKRKLGAGPIVPFAYPPTPNPDAAQWMATNRTPNPDAAQWQLYTGE
jgi:hypothetical protein